MDIDIEFTGLKSGEKLYEEVQHFDEVHAQTDHMRIFKFVANNDYPISLEAIEAKLSEAMKLHKADGIKGTVKSLVKEYCHQNQIFEFESFCSVSSTTVFFEKGLGRAKIFSFFLKYKRLA